MVGSWKAEGRARGLLARGDVGRDTLNAAPPSPRLPGSPLLGKQDILRFE